MRRGHYAGRVEIFDFRRVGLTCDSGIDELGPGESPCIVEVRDLARPARARILTVGGLGEGRGRARGEGILRFVVGLAGRQVFEGRADILVGAVEGVGGLRIGGAGGTGEGVEAVGLLPGDEVELGARQRAGGRIIEGEKLAREIAAAVEIDLGQARSLIGIDGGDAADRIAGAARVREGVAQLGVICLVRPAR